MIPAAWAMLHDQCCMGHTACSMLPGAMLHDHAMLAMLHDQYAWAMVMIF